MTVVGEKRWSCFCHCRNCTRVRGIQSHQAIGWPIQAFAITRGEEFVKTVKTKSSLLPAISGYTLGETPAYPQIYTFCGECGTSIYQRLEEKDLHIFPYIYISPTLLNIENEDSSVSCGVNCKLPEELLPSIHFNYENRAWDVHDDLVKWAVTGLISQRLNSDGSPMDTEEPRNNRKLT